MTGLLQGEQPYIWTQSDPPPVDLSVGDIRSHIAAEWLQIAQRSQWRAYRKLSSLFLMVPSLTPTTSSSPKMGFHMPQHTRMAISLQRVIRSTSCLVPRVGFSGTADLMALFPVRTNPRWRPPQSWKNFKWPYLRNRSSDPLHVWLYGGVFGDGGSNGAIFDSNKFKMVAAAILDNFEWPKQRLTIYLYSAHRAVIFAITQLSCYNLSALYAIARPSVTLVDQLNTVEVRIMQFSLYGSPIQKF